MSKNKLNRLNLETSPYLLQHQHNPVDWYPWGQEALALAKSLNRPILLSVGYSACHWCHVMERECFENAEIAAIMNQHFISIKVDREERPDLDHIYQGVAQAMTRSGGWPLTVFLTPDLKPFYGGTYFPPEDRYGRPGFPRLLQALSDAFREDHASVAENAEKLTAFIRGMDRAPSEPTLAEHVSASVCTSAIVDAIDPVLGGLRGAPKFPNVMLLSYLARQSQDLDARRALLLTLDRMACGGIYDQLGGGFHRYSVDETWSIPHFEKMLYDNGLLLKIYSEALLYVEISPEQKRLYTHVVGKTVEYLLREMRSSDGAFYCAQDADSEGEEGKFFAWTPSELELHVKNGDLTAEESSAFQKAFGVSDSGNFEHGLSILYRTDFKNSGELLEQACEKLLLIRSKRIAPATDTKVLASWNGLAISGLCWAAKALESLASDAAKSAIDAAWLAFECVRTKMGVANQPGRLMSTLQNGAAKHPGVLDDYAYMAAAALDLSRTLEEGSQAGLALGCAQKWVDVILEHFSDADAGYFMTSDDHEKLIHRPKVIYDQAVPCGTAVATEVMLALGELVADGARYTREAERQIRGFSSLIKRAPLGVGQFLCAALTHEQGIATVEGLGSTKFCQHPHVYRKPQNIESPKLLLCFKQTCHELNSASWVSSGRMSYWGWVRND